MRKLSDEIEAFPDLFMRRNWLPKLNDVRSKVADLIGANQDEVVIVPNATHGVNNIVTQINWQEGDVAILCKLILCAVTPAMCSHQSTSRTVQWRRQ
jgi:kynureninase